MREEKRDCAEKLDAELEARADSRKESRGGERRQGQPEGRGARGVWPGPPGLLPSACTPPPAWHTRAALTSPGQHQEW